mmetsp:Transcript_44051/g.109103  ORF Transcript_44051/g.109103 Transcript_44051/m.109103 type:complete len:222 (-) Transcript_44051:50-715(-)
MALGYGFPTVGAALKRSKASMGSSPRLARSRSCVRFAIAARIFSRRSSLMFALLRASRLADFERPRAFLRSLRLALRSASAASLEAFISAMRSPGERSTVPITETSSVMVSGLSFSSSAVTSASRLCFLVAYGFASKASKAASPAPGTSSDAKPSACPTPSTSSCGQNSTLATAEAGSRCDMYGAFCLVASASRHISTCGPWPTASTPRAEMSRLCAGRTE